MSNFLRYGLTAIALTFIFGAFSVSETNAQINEILKRMDVHYKKLKSLKADVKRERYNSQLKDTETMSGNISLIPGKDRNFALRLDWKKPREEMISVVNGQYIAYTPGIKQAWIGNADSKTVGGKGGSVLKAMSMSKEEIKANYNVEYLGQENANGVPTWHLKLTPKVKSNYKFTDLWVDGDGMPIQARVTELNNDTDTISLSSLKKNDTLDASIFNIKPPKGTTIVK